MKKKLTVNSLAFGNLRTRKKQYTIMIIGIILAMVFSSSVLFFIFSISASNDEMKRNKFGDQDCIISGTSESFIEDAEKAGVVNDYGFAHIIGFAYTNVEEKNNGAVIAWLDDKAKEISYQSFIEGNYPVNEDEIAIERDALLQLGIEPDIGESITLSVLTQNGDEYLDEAEQKTYKLVGIIRDKRANLSFEMADNTVIPAAFVCSDTRTELGGKESLFAYLKVFDDKADPESWGNFNKYMKSNGVDSESYHMIGAKTAGSSREAGDLTENLTLASILGAVLMAASCLAIINAFNTNLKERKKQIGMLRAVGTTKRQIIIIFGREAFLISIVCTPISIALSYLLVKALSRVFGDEFVFVFDWRVLILCAAAGIACVMLAALIPLFRASRITPMQAIRNIEVTRKMRSKHIKSQKEFSVEKLIAKRNMSFYKGSRFAVSFLLVVTIVLSCSGFSWICYEMDNIYESPFDYSLSGSYGSMSPYINSQSYETGYTESDRNSILSTPYISEVYGVKSCSINILADGYTDYLKIMFSDQYTNFENPDNITKDNYFDLTENTDEHYLWLKSELGYDRELISTALGATDNELIETLKKYVTDGKIDIDKINSGEEIILVAPKKVAFDFETLKGGGFSARIDRDNYIKSNVDYILTAECDYKAGDTVDLSVITASDYDEETGKPIGAKRSDKTVKIGAIISPDYNLNTGIYGEFGFLTTFQGMNNFSPNEKYDTIEINASQEITTDIDEYISSVLEKYSSKAENGEVISTFNIAASEKQYMRSVLISMLAVIILFFTVCASIVNNSLTASIRENKREIGTLRAVGASEKELVGSYIRQLLSMFIWGYGLGFAAFAIGYIVLIIVHKILQDNAVMVFRPWETIGLCVILFAVCSINLWVKVRKEMKNSIVENIREL